MPGWLCLILALAFPAAVVYLFYRLGKKYNGE